MQPLNVPSNLSAESVGILFALLPGLVMFLVVRALTQRSKKIEATEAVLHGLAYTLIVQAVGALIIAVLPAAAQFSSTLFPAIGLLLGIVLSAVVNTGWLYAFLRWARVTREGSSPCTWLDAFEEARRKGVEFAVLHFNDGRRIYGNLRGVSDEPTDGHVVLNDYRWLDEHASGSTTVVGGSLLAKQADIRFVEFVPHERKGTHV